MPTRMEVILFLPCLREPCFGDVATATQAPPLCSVISHYSNNCLMLLFSPGPGSSGSSAMHVSASKRTGLKVLNISPNQTIIVKMPKEDKEIDRHQDRTQVPQEDKAAFTNQPEQEPCRIPQGIIYHLLHLSLFRFVE